jgi:hypothetical protein
MALRRIPAPDLFKVTVRQPLQELPPKGFCYISFRAGIMRKTAEGKLTADKRKGQVAIVKDDSGCTALQWYERVFAEGADAESFTLAAEAEVEELLFEHQASCEWLKKDKRVLKVTFKDVRNHNLLQSQRMERKSELIAASLVLRCSWMRRCPLSHA